MSKNLRRNFKDSKEGKEINLKDSEEQMNKYLSKKNENLDFELKYFLISLSIIFSTNIYIHKNVK